MMLAKVIGLVFVVLAVVALSVGVRTREPLGGIFVGIGSILLGILFLGWGTH